MPAAEEDPQVTPDRNVAIRLSRSLALRLALVALVSGAAPDAARAYTSTFLTPFDPPDARSLAIGSAFTAIAGGPLAAWWNPGALALEEGLDAMPVTYSDLGWRHAGEGSTSPFEVSFFALRAARKGVGVGGWFCRTHLYDSALRTEITVHYVGLAGGVDLFRAGGGRKPSLAGSGLPSSESTRTSELICRSIRSWPTTSTSESSRSHPPLRSAGRVGPTLRAGYVDQERTSAKGRTYGFGYTTPIGGLEVRLNLASVPRFEPAPRRTQYGVEIGFRP